jgi:hypothetical protein
MSTNIHGGREGGTAAISSGMATPAESTRRRLRTYCRTLDDKRLLSVYMNEPQSGLLSKVARSEIDRRRTAKASPKLLGAR